MFSDAPDSAARSFLFSSLIWLVIGATAAAVAGIQLAKPGFGGIGFGSAQAIASISLQYGWLNLASLAAIFYVIPRVTGRRMRSERSGSAAAVIINASIALGVLLLLGQVGGKPFAEMPRYLWGALTIAHLLVAVNVLATVSRRRGSEMFASAWHMTSAAVAFPAVLIMGRLPHLRGAPDVVLDGFALDATLLLGFASVGIGACYYLVARASGGVFYNHRVAMAGFWLLLLAGPLAGGARHLFGPTVPWVQSIGSAAWILMTAVGVCVLVCTVGTLRGAWERIAEHPSVLYMVAGSLLFFAATVQGAVQSSRSVARSLGLTDASTSHVWLLIGCFTLWMSGALVYSFPRLMGRRWVSRSWVDAHLWMSVVGILVWVGSMWVAGVLHAAVVNAGVSAGSPFAFGPGFDVILVSLGRTRVALAAGVTLFAVAQSLLALSVIRSISMGEPRSVEVVDEAMA